MGNEKKGGGGFSFYKKRRKERDSFLPGLEKEVE